MGAISAVIITKNEEENIGRCLNSLEGVVDEVIVVDSRSTDNTQKICEEHGVTFESIDFKGYSATKNYGNSLASGDYILSVDADEFLSDDLKAAILEIKKDPNADGYTVNRRSNYLGRWIKYCGWYPDRKLRIWKKGKGQWIGKIHESLKLKTTNVKHLEGDLLHYTYKTTTEHLDQINHFTDLMAREMYAGGKRSSAIKLVFSPIFKFIQKYFFKLGFLDGFEGFILCVFSGYYTFAKYAKLRELQKNKAFNPMSLNAGEPTLTENPE